MGIISLEKAKEMICEGIAKCEGQTKFDDVGKAHLIITCDDHVDHVPIDDSNQWLGCYNCGEIVIAEEDRYGCGCHCPKCHAGL